MTTAGAAAATVVDVGRGVSAARELDVEPQAAVSDKQAAKTTGRRRARIVGD
jgi:hypothetical protein